MNTEREYINMCNCPELQDWWNTKEYHKYINRKAGDFVFIPDQTILIESDIDRHQHYNESVSIYDFNDSLQYVWIARVDQIQKFMLEHENRPWRLDEWYMNWIPRGLRYDSFEKSWLWFFMDELHNQQWNGKQWVVCR